MSLRRVVIAHIGPAWLWHQLVRTHKASPRSLLRWGAIMSGVLVLGTIARRGIVKPSIHYTPERCAVTRSAHQQTQNICITLVQCWTSVEDVGPTLYKCYTNVLCLLGNTRRPSSVVSLLAHYLRFNANNKAALCDCEGLLLWLVTIISVRGNGSSPSAGFLVSFTSRPILQHTPAERTMWYNS